VLPKVEELKNIFKECGEEMEWEAIEEEAYKEFEDGCNSIQSSEWLAKLKKESLKRWNHMT
jgi:hypothetical protein